MEDKDLFVLAYSWYEEYTPYYFWGSEWCSEEQFQQICDGLIDQATFDAIKAESNAEYGGWIGWHDIVTALIPLLEKEGFTPFQPKIKVIKGSNIIDEPRDAKILGSDAAAAVIKYNKDKAGESGY